MRLFTAKIRYDWLDVSAGTVAITGGDRAGFLYPDIETGEGYVHRVPSPLELMLSSGKAIFIKDLSDPTEIPTVG